MSDTNAKGQTALHIASEAGHASVITALLSQGVNFRACDIEGAFPMPLTTSPFPLLLCGKFEGGIPARKLAND